MPGLDLIRGQNPSPKLDERMAGWRFVEQGMLMIRRIQQDVNLVLEECRQAILAAGLKMRDATNSRTALVRSLVR